MEKLTEKQRITILKLTPRRLLTAGYPLSLTRHAVQVLTIRATVFGLTDLDALTQFAHANWRVTSLAAMLDR